MRRIDLTKLFSSPSGRLVYQNAVKAISDFSMRDSISRGVLVGLSGGADSVMLLSFLKEYRKEIGDFPILAVHVNHGIRGQEADRDEAFSREFADALGIDFISRYYDVPSLSRERGKGLEETAREVRYSCFEEIISSRNDISFLAVAHNSTDNLETVLLNILRGAGSRGASGIPPRRDNILRPLIYSKKELILCALCEGGISYVTDSTNLSSDYKRNYIRNRILPHLRSVCENPEEMFSRFSANLRSDDECLNTQAEQFLALHKVITNTELNLLSRAVLRRVLVKMSGINISENLLSDLKNQLNSDNFRYDIGEGLVFLCERKVCSVIASDSEFQDYSGDILFGKNDFSAYFSEIILSEDSLTKTYQNVYKFSIQHDLSGVIIRGKLRVRPKQDGDTIYYGGMTRKLKKLFSDRKIPKSKRNLIPVICDDFGVVCVPGFGVRDDGGKREGKKLFLTLGILCENEYRFYIGSEFRT